MKNERQEDGETARLLNQTRQFVNGTARRLCEQRETHATLLRVVATVASDRCIREDLLQEALIHLWQLKDRHPGQRPSWYFKSCQLHLLNLLRKGRSIDSLKHRKNRIRPSDPAVEDSSESGGLTELVDHSDSEEPVFEEGCARDILTSLYQWLDPPDRLILDCLADGLSAREIAAHLQLSHTAVVKR